MNTEYGLGVHTLCMVMGMTYVAIHLVVTDPDAAADWYRRAFGATEVSRLSTPAGQTFTVELRLGGTTLAVAGEMPDRRMLAPATLDATSAAFHIAVTDVDAAWATAMAAGAVEYQPVHDAFWGERTGQLLDPFGHRWALNQHLRDVPADELQRQVDALFGGVPQAPAETTRSAEPQAAAAG